MEMEFDLTREPTSLKCLCGEYMSYYFVNGLLNSIQCHECGKTPLDLLARNYSVLKEDFELVERVKRAIK